MLGITLAVVGVVLAAYASLGLASGVAAIWAWALSLVALVGAAWAERNLFFTAAAPDRMPGGFH